MVITFSKSMDRPDEITNPACGQLCMVITYSKSMDQPGKVANPARGQLNRENE